MPDLWMPALEGRRHIRTADSRRAITCVEASLCPGALLREISQPEREPACRRVRDLSMGKGGGMGDLLL